MVLSRSVPLTQDFVKQEDELDHDVLLHWVTHTHPSVRVRPPLAPPSPRLEELTLIAPSPTS
jgi:hypothetical protein